MNKVVHKAKMLEIKRIDHDALKTDRLKEDPRIAALRDADGVLHVVAKSEHDAKIAKLEARCKELEQQIEVLKVAHSISMPKPLYDSMKAKNEALDQQLKKAESVIEFYGDGFRLCQLISDNASFTENTITLKDENITERARQYLKSRGE